jgi:hypothetical protein
VLLLSLPGRWQCEIEGVRNGLLCSKDRSRFVIGEEELIVELAELCSVEDVQ